MNGATAGAETPHGPRPLADAVERFGAAMAVAGLTPPEIIADGKIHRFSTNDTRGDDAGWYVLHADGIPAGSYGDFRTGITGKWCANIGRQLTPAEELAHRARLDAMRQQRDAETARQHTEAATTAAVLWQAGAPARADHPYLTRKRVQSVTTLRELPIARVIEITGYPPQARGVALTGRILLAPVTIDDAISTVELIDERGHKSALAGGAKVRGYWASEQLPAGDGTGRTILIGEGVATMLTATEASEYPAAAAALSSGNLPAVAETMRARYPAADLVIVADVLKASGEPDPHAIAAARAVGARLAVPRWNGERPADATDINDLAAMEGIEAVRACISAAVVVEVGGGEDTTAPAALRVLTLRELLTEELPARDTLLAPWLPQQGLAMVYAPRGVGKTFFGLNVAYAVASGSSYLRFHAPHASRVLLIDGEMPLAALQARLARITASADRELPEDDYLRILAADTQRDALPDLSTLAGQERIDPYLAGVDLVILDNISTLCRTGVENEAEGWGPVQAWALRLRRQGISVVFIHHAGKGGAQRGTSKREDVLDTVIKLKHPADYDPQHGARFEVHFEKARGLTGDDVAPFEAAMNVDDRGREVWTVASLDSKEAARVVELHGEGLSQRDIATEVGMSLGKVNRLIQAAKVSADHGGGHAAEH